MRWGGSVCFCLFHSLSLSAKVKELLKSDHTCKSYCKHSSGFLLCGTRRKYKHSRTKYKSNSFDYHERVSTRTYQNNARQQQFNMISETRNMYLPSAKILCGHPPEAENLSFWPFTLKIGTPLTPEPGERSRQFWSFYAFLSSWVRSMFGTDRWARPVMKRIRVTA